MRIQHNIMAMSAYRNYTNNVSAMKKNLEKLSSGYKINRAGDDAAGLAISEKMRAQITGLETAQKNAKDGISLVQTAEGALTEVHDMLNRMVELATQSANGTYDNTTDRAQMQKELNQLRDEIDRIADSSNFNGIKLLDGSMDSGATTTTNATQDITDISGAFEIVADGNQISGGGAAVPGVYEADLSDMELKLSGTSGNAGSVTIKIGGQTVAAFSGVTLQDDAISVTAAALTGTGATQISVGTSAGAVTLNVDVTNGKITLTMADDPTEAQIATMEGLALNVTFEGGTGTTIDANSNGITGVVGNQAYGQSIKPTTLPKAEQEALFAQGKIDLSKLNITDGAKLKIGDKEYTFAVGKDSTIETKDASGNAIAGVIDLTAYEADAIDYKDAAQQIANTADPTEFKVSTPNNDGTIHVTEKKDQIDYTENDLHGTDGNKKDGNWKGLITFDASGKGAQSTQNKALTLQIGDTADPYNQLKVSIKDMHVKSMGKALKDDGTVDSSVANGSLSIEDISIADQSSAATAVDVIKRAINYVSDMRGTLGATQNRLDHTINNLSVMTENIQDAESTIRDVDVAEEMMAYTKNNILIQSAQAMLAQANQVPQGVLQLLQ